MALELHRLVEKVEHLDITTMAGRNGLHNLVSWVQMAENIEASTFLEGGEVIIITGIGLQKESDLAELVAHLYDKKAAGIIINTGPYIEEIPPEVIAFCDSHNLPLFSVPWKVHLSEIMRIFCFSITRESQRNAETSAAFKNAIFFPDQQELYVVPLSQLNFDADWKYSVCLIRLHNTQNTVTSRLEVLSMSLENHLRHHQYLNFAIFTHNDELLCVTGDYSGEELHAFIEDLRMHAKIYLLKEESITMGVGRLTQSIRCLHKSYAQAQSIERLQSNKKIDADLIHYAQMGFYRLLMGIEDHTILEEYYETTLGPLIRYDKANDSDLAEVLKYYLNKNGSVQDTAAELYVHRNTINYKLRKIASLLDVDLSDLQVRMQLIMAFKIQDVL